MAGTGDALVGTLVEFTSDGLGWIALDSGARLRFGASAWRGERTEAALAIGTRVRVGSTAPGFRGVVKAVDVWPLVPAAPPAPPPDLPADLPPGEPALTWAELVERYPRWSDVATIALVPHVPAPPLLVAPPADFAAYHDELVATTPTVMGLQVARWKAQQPIEPTIADDFSHGTVAFLDDATWPDCQICSMPLEMCLQLSAATLAPWLPGRGGLVAMFCFRCGYHHTTTAGYVRLVRDGRRVEQPACEPSPSSDHRPASQRVTRSSLGRRVPSDSWYLCRYERDGAVDSAAAELQLRADDSDELVEILERFDAWRQDVAASSYGADVVGGAPRWDQRERTPRCAHGEMRQLVEYNGDQFLDGALHVFVCTDGCDDVAYVAEF